jgi:hypothetical protein
MRRWIIVWVLFATMATAAEASARQAVIGLNDPPPPADSAPKAEPEKPKPQVGYKSGFYIQSPDEKYKLVISGYLQLQFEYLREGGENNYGFRVRRARLSFLGNLFNKDFTYKFQFDFAKFSTELLLDAYVNYRMFDGDFEVQVGQQTIPYIRQHQISSSAQMFVERSLASNEFINTDDVDTDGDGVPDKLSKNGRDIGIQLQGKPFDKKLEYQAGIFNGNGTNTTNINNDFLYMGRVVWNVLGNAGYSYEGDLDHSEHPSVFLGGSGNYNVRTVSKDKVVHAGLETGLKYKGFATTGEFFFRNIKPGSGLLAESNDYGYYAQAGYFVIPKRMEVAARASQVFFAGLQNDQAEFQLGVNGFIYGNNLKLQTDYSVLPNNTTDGLDTAQRFRLRLQTKF